MGPRNLTLQSNNSFKPTPCRGVGHVLYATLAHVRRPATGRLNSGVRPLSRVPAIFFVLFLAGCATAPVSDFSSAKCESAGGTVTRLGHFIYVCQWPTTDAGRICTSSTDCQGYCALPAAYWKDVTPDITTLNLPHERPMQGVCSNYQPEKTPNCGFSIEKGQLEQWPCID